MFASNSYAAYTFLDAFTMGTGKDQAHWEVAGQPTKTSYYY